MSVDFLAETIQFIKGVGPARARALERAGVSTVRDLLHYYPRRYLDRSTVTAVRDLRSDADAATVVGQVVTAGIVPGRRRRFEIVVQDDRGGRITCVWFRGVAWVSKLFEIGNHLAIHGKPRKHRGGWSFSHPEFDRIDERAPNLDTGRIIPLYPGTADLASAGVSSRALRRILYTLFKEQGLRIPETLPDSILEQYDLLPGKVALRAIHFPKSEAELSAAIRRLKFEELFFVQLMLARIRQARQVVPGPRLDGPGPRSKRFLEEVLPFSLTAGQREALQDIERDTSRAVQMNRLIQGDVGAGKTVVAVAALLLAIDSGYQGAFMAPTEILAMQHYKRLRRYLEPLDVSVSLLVGGQSKDDRRDRLYAIKKGRADVVVGTHALIQEGVEFDRLGLAVVDEQHRFGVMQRATMFDKGENPHMLLMTATPIPRSLAMTLYGDLDVSVIREKPAGRLPVRTVLRRDADRDAVYDTVKTALQTGQQAYVVFPLVEESETLALRDLESEFKYLREKLDPFTVEMMHGRMSGREKDAIMDRFKTGVSRVLAATTVIEVGVDVPTANVMVIEHAERFGLSQLHQLRGRIGRGTEKALCVLLASVARSSEAKERLQAMVKTNDGFEISERDLQLRGAGDFFGTRQSGIPDFKIADLRTDTNLLVQARDAAGMVLRDAEEGAGDGQTTMKLYFERFYEQGGLKMAQIG